jgi:hypothetical protein
MYWSNTFWTAGTIGEIVMVPFLRLVHYVHLGSKSSPKKTQNHNKNTIFRIVASFSIRRGFGVPHKIQPVHPRGDCALQFAQEKYFRLNIDDCC